MFATRVPKCDQIGARGNVHSYTITFLYYLSCSSQHHGHALCAIFLITHAIEERTVFEALKSLGFVYFCGLILWQLKRLQGIVVREANRILCALDELSMHTETAGTLLAREIS